MRVRLLFSSTAFREPEYEATRLRATSLRATSLSSYTLSRYTPSRYTSSSYTSSSYTSSSYTQCGGRKLLQLTLVQSVRDCRAGTTMDSNFGSGWRTRLPGFAPPFELSIFVGITTDRKSVNIVRKPMSSVLT